MRAGVRLAVPSAETPFLQVSTTHSFYTQAPHSKSPLLIPHYWWTTTPASFVLVWIPPVRGKNLWAEYVLRVILGSWSEGVVGENANARQRWRKWALWVTGGKAVPSRTSKLLSFGESAMGRRELSYTQKISFSCSWSQRWAAGQHPSSSPYLDFFSSSFHSLT